MSSTTPAHPQTLPPADAPAEVVPPKLMEDVGVTYPRAALAAGRTETVQVTLILEIDAAGAVTAVELDQGAGSLFDDEAVRAAGALRFEPARRSGTPVPARVRFRYVFEPPPPSLAGRVVDAGTGLPVVQAQVTVRGSSSTRTVATGADGTFRFHDLPSGVTRLSVQSPDHAPQATDVTLVPGDETRVRFELDRSAPLGEPSAAAPIEVTVRGEPRPPAVSSYTREEVRRIPGAFGDPFRAVETLPGVTPVSSGLPYFYVRGAPPGNVGYFLDGVRVPYLYHIGIGPSVIQPAIVDRVDLYSGGYPARLGRFAGGIVAADTADPRPELHGEGTLRLFDVGGVVEGGFGGGRGTALVGGRYSYTAALLSLIAPEITLDYRDYQARLSYDVSPNDRLTVFGFGAYDLLGEVQDDVLHVLFGTEFHRADLRYDHRFDGGRLRTAVTFGYDRTHAAELQANVVARSVGARTELARRLNDRTLLRAGTNITLEGYRVDPSPYRDPENPETEAFSEQFRPRTDLAFGGWTDVTLNLTEALEVTPGLRVDLYRSGEASAVGLDPRLAARLALGPNARLVSTLGVAHQPPSFALPVPGLVPSLQEGLQRSVQSSAGAEIDLDDATTAGLTPFYNAFTNMTDALGAWGGDGAPDFQARSDGRSFGLELFFKRRLTRRLGGFFSYTLSRSERTVGEERFPSAFDRTHVINAAASYRLGRGWSTGGRVLFYSGAPIQPSADGAIVLRTGDVEREPPFVRLDLRLEKRWTLGKGAFIAFVAEVLNASLSKQTLGAEEIGPLVIPSLGAEVGF